jgi:hypothetical protein
MSTRHTPFFSLLAWLPLVAALSLVARSARTAVAVLLLGLGGYVASPLAEVAHATVPARVRRVRRVRAPDATDRCREP